MFEDSTFESTGRIHTRSRRWMVAAFAFNASLLLALVLVPLFYPEALPRMAMIFLMETPPPQVEVVKPVAEPVHASTAAPEIQGGSIMAPPKIPTHIYIPGKPEEPTPDIVAAMGGGGPGAVSPDNPFTGRGAHTTVRQAVAPKQQVSRGVMEGLLVHKVIPEYPPIARTIHLSGTVVLQATISKSGTIENLRVVSGPQMLQTAALNAVKEWRYRPYLLNGEPVEVETTVNVQFTLQ